MVREKNLQPESIMSLIGRSEVWGRMYLCLGRRIFDQVRDDEVGFESGFPE